MYQSQSGGVVDTLNKLLEDAQTQLGEACAEETAGIQAFEMLMQHLEGEIKFANKEWVRQSRACLHPKRIRRFLNETSKNLAEGIKTS